MTKIENSSTRIRMMLIQSDRQRGIICKEHPIYEGRCDGPDTFMTEEFYCTSAKHNNECMKKRMILKGYMEAEK